MEKYSILMSVYYKEKPEYLEESIASMLNQTHFPNQFVIVQDGPLTDELQAVIDGYFTKYHELFTIIKLETNMGLGLALAQGVLACRNEWIVRMDSDDISVPERCAKQMTLASTGKYDMIGSLVDEFTGTISNVKAHVMLPESHEEIVKFSHRRNPFRHSSLAMRKSIILKAGNYRDFYLYEDYDMFTRMIMVGAIGYNIQEPLTYMRISSDFYMRRGGWKYFKSIFRLRKELFQKHYTNFKDFCVASASNLIVCIMPNGIRNWIYLHLLRG